MSAVVERLLCISGEDALTIERKFLEAVTLKLPTRFMFLANELPRVDDASAALSSRFLVVQLENSFYGREDRQLTVRLLRELPGILRWALEGWRRLQARGCFAQPASGATSSPKPIRPGTVNRELDTLRSVLSKAVEWGKLLDNPMRLVKRLRVDNRRTRILTDEEQRRLLAASPKKLRALVALAPITGARVGELLALRWEDVQEGFLTFWQTKNGRRRRIPLSPTIDAVLASLPRMHDWVFTNARRDPPHPYTVNGAAHVFHGAVLRADITSGDVTLHTLRHTALSRMIAAGLDDYTVMEISGHSSTQLLARYTHPTEQRKQTAVVLPAIQTGAPAPPTTPAPHSDREDDPTLAELRELLEKVGGRQEARTPDLRVANAALSQLS